MGQLEELYLLMSPADYRMALTRDVEARREYYVDYDEFRRPTELSICSLHGKEGQTIEQVLWCPAYDPEGRPLQLIGPGNDIMEYEYTARGELESVSRGNLSAELTYDAAGRLTRIDYGNGTAEIRVYDEANRLTEIRHEDGGEVVLWSVTYDWTINNWVESRTEFDGTVIPTVTAVVDFEYDNRGRLIGETRVVDGTTTTYDIAYTYDQLGNRLRKTDAVAGLTTVYTYDTQLPAAEMDYPTRNNRLLEYRVYDGNPEDPNDLRRTVTYTYYQNGDASNITVKDEYVDAETTPGDPNDYAWQHDLALYYHADHTLRLGLWDRWQVDQDGDPIPATYEKDAAREFRYDPVAGGPRARYAEAFYDDLIDADPNEWHMADPVRWTEYAGVSPYVELEVSGEDPNAYDVTAVRRYLGTAGDEPLDEEGAPLDTRFYHGDLIGSTGLLTDQSGDAGVSPAVAYTAFGEVLDGSGSPGGSPPEGSPRYQYAGRYGYESDLLVLQGVNANLPSITLEHVGHRWYQPDIGRFVQRDPIGIFGGWNVFGYVCGRPTMLIDPVGLAVPHWTDGLPPTLVDWMGTAGVGGGFAGASTATLTGGSVLAGGGAGAFLGVAAAWIWFGGKAVCIQAGDLLDTLDELGRSKAKNRKQRRNNPEDFPPRPRRPIKVPRAPCGHPW